MLSPVEAWWAGLCALPFDGAQGDTPLCLNAPSTHPDVAALVTPLSASRIEGIFLSFSPSLRLVAERVVQRSVDRVSQFCDSTTRVRSLKRIHRCQNKLRGSFCRVA